jgi:hypothetical protein
MITDFQSPSSSSFDPQPYLDELLKERSEDITHRKNAGIEEVWRRARTQYAHGDAEKATSGFEKGRDLDGPISKGYSEPDGDGRSTVSVNITRPYSNAGTARTADLLLPAGERDNWDLRETPISDLEALRPYFEAQPELVAMLPPRLALRLQQPPEVRKLAIAKCRELIKDYLTETDFASKTRKQIKEAGITGTGVLYGPFPEERKLTPDVVYAVELLVSAVPEELRPARRFELEMKVLRRPALTHNLAWMQNFVRRKGVALAPHGKTTLSPELFRMQLQAGAWGLTFANVHQLRVGLAAGVQRALIANQLVTDADLDGLDLLLCQNPQARVQTSPRIMNVAVPWCQHSPMFGQRASSQTVCRPCSRISPFSRR